CNGRAARRIIGVRSYFAEIRSDTNNPDVPAILGAWGGDIDAPEGRSPHSSDIGSLLSPSTQPQPPEFTAGLSSAIRHLSSAISLSPFPVPHSAFSNGRGSFAGSAPVSGFREAVADSLDLVTERTGAEE